MPKTILIVDDSLTMIMSLKSNLELNGFKVETASDGLQALTKLKSGLKPDLIITDINMPRMDGITFIKTVREQDSYRDIPIVVLSTEGEDRDIHAGLSIGANLYMVKPAQPEIMVRNVKMLLG